MKRHTGDEMHLQCIFATSTVMLILLVVALTPNHPIEAALPSNAAHRRQDICRSGSIVFLSVQKKIRKPSIIVL